MLAQIEKPIKTYYWTCGEKWLESGSTPGKHGANMAIVLRYRPGAAHKQILIYPADLQPGCTPRLVKAWQHGH